MIASMAPKPRKSNILGCVVAALAAGVLLAAVSVRAEPPEPQRVTEYRLPPDKLEQAEALYRTRNALALAGLVLGVAVPLALLQLGVAARYRDLAESPAGDVSCKRSCSFRSRC